MLNFKGEIINMKINKYIIGISLIGVLSLAGFALASANEKVTTVDGKEVVQAYNNLINKKGIDPDIEVEDDKKTELDEQLQKAIEECKK